MASPPWSAGLVRWCIICPHDDFSQKWTATPLTPEQQIKALQVQLREANEKAQLFEAIVDVLKEDYGVRIVKKPSGKSSRKGASKA
ncbi:hypothetical protein [Stenotrophomonas maltophilia]|uniref:hypothetical protein n=1 Tax=Stenotrophomonas maltophilia TaxID=40324 RepID=UPI00240E643C|nr:hypothetical protein [Stenotrophomonas maltophilia]MDG2509065.1 hypothetical protein [Stenotrophomonas maltophilia]HEL5041424.1 hypothetical protein [Stenotrophomonas maltophilia]